MIFRIGPKQSEREVEVNLRHGGALWPMHESLASKYSRALLSKKEETRHSARNNKAINH